MIQRFDHAVIGVPDLAAGMAAFRRMGLQVAEGGRHPSLGTRNAIVRFGLDYLELLTVENPEQARSRGSFGAELLDFLERSSGLVGYVLAGTDLQEQVDGFRMLGMEADGPFAMDRIRPDGRRLEWRLVVPGGSPWRKPWPYLIDWITPEANLLDWDPAGNHELGVTGVAGIDLVVEDLDAAQQLYDHALGLRRHRIPSEQPSHDAHGCFYQLKNLVLGLHQPTTEGPMSRELARRGPGPYRLTLSIPHISSTIDALTRRGIPFQTTPHGADIDPKAALGVRLRLRAG